MTFSVSDNLDSFGCLSDKRHEAISRTDLIWTLEM